MICIRFNLPPLIGRFYALFAFAISVFASSLSASPSFGTSELLSANPDFLGSGTVWKPTPVGRHLLTNVTAGYQVRWSLDGLHQGPGGVCIEAKVHNGAIHVGLLDRKQNRFLDSCTLSPASRVGTLRFDQAAGCSLILSNGAGGSISEALVSVLEVRAVSSLTKPPELAVATSATGSRKDQLADNRYSGSPPYLFSSWEFVFLFLPVVLSLVAIARTRVGWLVGVLVLASFVWYSAWDVRFAPLITVSVLGNWLLGKWVARTGSKSILTLAVVLNLLPLLWFKYTRFGFVSVGLRAEDWILPDFLPVVLPLGISFYTFQQIGYIVDIRSRPEQQEPSLWHYSLFVLFFPQLVAGPIVQHQQFLPQLGKSREMSRWFAKGLTYFVLGLGKKLLIADPIGASIDPFFAPGGCTDASQAWAAIIGYGCQLYFDFSGYSDMAIGLGAMFGFDIPVNFLSPYKANSITDFWRRWHITLSTFLRDYVYIPLGGNRGRPWTRYRNLMLTMLIGGLWHGAGWAFVLWGGLHGLLLAVEHYCRARFPSVSLGWVARPLTLLTVLLLWVPFRTEDVGVAVEILGKAIVPGWQIETRLAVYCLVGLLVAVLAPSSHSIAPHLARWPLVVREAVWVFACRSGAYALVGLVGLSAVISSYYSTIWDRKAAQAGFTLAMERGIANKQGDLRNNMLRVEVLARPEQKWVVTGSSFAGGMPTLAVDGLDGRSVVAGSAGIGGQSLANWSRTAMSVCDMPGVEVMLVAVSPVALTGAVDGEPFRSQGWDMLELTGVEPKERSPMSRLGSSQVPFLRVASALISADIWEQPWFQLHGYARLIINSRWGRSVVPVPLTSERELAVRAKVADWRARGGTVAIKDAANGTDAKFHWRSRGAIESISHSGAAWRTLVAIRDFARSRGVRLVVYETPTVSPSDDAEYYPLDFWDSYSNQMQRTCVELGIEYWDLSRFLPWNGEAMWDFIHPTTAAREAVLMELCRRLLDTKEGRSQ